jgi:hypothetical protein
MKQIRKKHSLAFKARGALTALQGEQQTIVELACRLKSTPARFIPGRKP